MHACMAQELFDAVEEVGGTWLITADHGNAEDMVQRDKKTGEPLMENGAARILTSHTLNPVSHRFCLFSPCACITPLMQPQAPCFEPLGNVTGMLCRLVPLGPCMQAPACMRVCSEQCIAERQPAGMHMPCRCRWQSAGLGCLRT